MKLFRDLTPEEEDSFRDWARQNYQPFSEISGVWHPVIQDEARRINEQTELDFTDIAKAMALVQHEVLD